MDERIKPIGRNQGQGDAPEDNPGEHQNHPHHHQPTKMIGQTEPRVRNPGLTNGADDRDGADNSSAIEEEDGQDQRGTRKAQGHHEHGEQGAGDD